MLLKEDHKIGDWNWRGFLFVMVLPRNTELTNWSPRLSAHTSFYPSTQNTRVTYLRQTKIVTSLFHWCAKSWKEEFVSCRLDERIFFYSCVGFFKTPCRIYPETKAVQTLRLLRKNPVSSQNGDLFAQLGYYFVVIDIKSFQDKINVSAKNPHTTFSMLLVFLDSAAQ